jgi:hypothetical protein
VNAKWCLEFAGVLGKDPHRAAKHYCSFAICEFEYAWMQLCVSNDFNSDTVEIFDVHRKVKL